MKDKPDIEKVVGEIEDRYAIRLMKDGDYYRVKIGNTEYSFRVGQFDESAHYGGEYYISVDTHNSKELCGSGCPCRNLDEVFEELKARGLTPVKSTQMRLF